MKIIILQILISIVLCATLVVIAYYVGAKRGIPRLEKYKKNLTEAVDDLLSTTVEETINIDCDGIFKYNAIIRKENNPKKYNTTVDVMVYTSTNRTYGFSHRPEKTEKEITYYLHYINWYKNSTAFIGENESDKYSAPELIFNREVKVVSTEGGIFYVTLIPGVIKELPPGKKEIDDFRKSVYRNINKMLDDTTYQHKYFAGLIADYRKHLNLRIADELLNKIHPAKKSSEEVQRLTKELNTIEKKYKDLKYKLEMYGIKKIDDITLEDAKYLQSAQELLKSKNND